MKGIFLDVGLYRLRVYLTDTRQNGPGTYYKGAGTNRKRQSKARIHWRVKRARIGSVDKERTVDFPFPRSVQKHATRFRQIRARATAGLAIVIVYHVRGQSFQADFNKLIIVHRSNLRYKANRTRLPMSTTKY